MARCPLAMILFAALGVCGCSHNLPSAALPAPQRIIMAQGEIDLSLQPTPPRQLDPTDFTIHFFDTHYHPVSHAQVSLDLTMPSMAMPKTTVPTHEQSPGTYAGSGQFSMPGVWRVTIMAVHGKTGIAHAFPITVH